VGSAMCCTCCFKVLGATVLALLIDRKAKGTFISTIASHGNTGRMKVRNQRFPANRRAVLSSQYLFRLAVVLSGVLVNTIVPCHGLRRNAL
jgi:hypothetical protein